MTVVLWELSRDIRDLAIKLTAEGWDRLRGLRLVHAAMQVLDECRRIEWLEAAGRAGELVDIYGEFVREAPMEEKLASALRAATAMANLLEAGRLADAVDRSLLPAQPECWVFVLAGEISGQQNDLAETLVSLGFSVTRATTVDAVVEGCATRQTILLAAASWLTANAERLVARLTAPADARSASPLIVALVDSDDFRSQVKARQAGARLLLDAPLDAPRLITELAGLAWMPRMSYRVLIVDDDGSVLEAHAGMLRNAGFEVLAVDDPVAAREFLDEFVPEVCVLDVEMPACKGTDLAALLRRDKRFARLPVIYLSAFADFDHQLDARQAGGEDYLVKPIDPRLLVAAVMARARQFRMFEAAYRQRRLAWQQLESLKSALDVHAIVSVATADGTIIDVNCKFCEVSGYRREELIGRNHRIVKSGRHPPAFFEDMWRTISSGRIWQGELENRKKDGNPYWVHSIIVPILDERGQPAQYVSIRTDITEQKRMLARRERQNRLLDLLRQALQHFIASHDVAATSAHLLDGMLLLTDSAYGFIGEVLHDPDGTPSLLTHAITDIAWNEATRRIFDDAQGQGMEFRNLDTLIGTVLRTGELVITNDPANDPRRGGLPEGHPPLDAFLGVPIRYGDMLVGMVGLANRPGGYDESLVDFLGSFTATYASILEAARLRHFQQIVINELQSARDAAEQANRTKSELLADWGKDLRTPLNAVLGHAQILLMNDALQAEIRQQVEEIGQGGEQLVRLIGDMLERIHATAAPDARPALAVPIMVVAERNGTRRRILVAEDNPANQAVLRMQLEVLGFDSDIAADGVTGLAKWKAGGHDLILADRNMPGMDGPALARAIRAAERESGGYVPIIAITAGNDSGALAACREAGMDDALPKPINMDDLHRMLARWLPRSSPVPLVDDVSRLSAPESGAVLDTGYLARIVGGAKFEQVRELVDIFTATVYADLPACHRLLEERDGRGLSLVMHKLKSSARMVGALRFARLAESLEGTAKGGRLDAAATLLGELEPAVHDVEDAVLQLAVSPATIFVAGEASLPADALPRCVLVVDDDPVARRQLGMLLSALGVAEVLSADGAEAGLAEIARENAGIDLLVSDLNMPGMDGIEFMRQLAEVSYRGCLIVCSGVEDRLLQTAADYIQAKGLSLRGILKKPVTRESLLQLLAGVCGNPAASAGQRGRMAVSPDEIMEGIRRNEFDVHFQPKVDAATLHVVGVEALARWERDGGPVPPDVFIGAAERHGLIAPLSELLVTKAVIGGARLAEAGFPLNVAVNLSANWLTDVRLPEFIMASLQATAFKAENLTLEITESGAMTDLATALDVMTRLRLKGLKLSIDDFGTGYSSMAQLQRIPVGELKLDRSFVRGAAENPATRVILAASIEMALKLNLTTVAEGVETQADLDLLRGLGCDQVQGWLIAKAMPLEVLMEWLCTWPVNGSRPA